MCPQFTGGGSGSGGKAAKTRRGGQPSGPGAACLASDLRAPESGAPLPGAVTGVRGSDPEPTAHTCTASERSAAAESAQRKRRKSKKLTNQPKRAFASTFHPDYLELA